MTISKLDPSSEKLAALVVARYPKPELENAFKSFVWRGSDFEASVYERQRLEQNLVRAVRDGRSTPIVDSIYEIYKWGFGRKAPNSDSTDWLECAIRVIKEFSSSTPNIDSQKLSLVALMSCNRIGIATASKWICFCDQERYGIYDSRVSLALRSFETPTGERIFPTVQRRNTKNSKHPNPDYLTSDRMVEKYFLFLDTLRHGSKMTGLSVAQIEMALFMLGK